MKSRQKNHRQKSTEQQSTQLQASTQSLFLPFFRPQASFSWACKHRWRMSLVLVCRVGPVPGSTYLYFFFGSSRRSESGSGQHSLTLTSNSSQNKNTHRLSLYRAPSNEPALGTSLTCAYKPGKLWFVVRRMPGIESEVGSRTLSLSL